MGDGVALIFMGISATPLFDCFLPAAYCEPLLPPTNRNQREAHDSILRQFFLVDAVGELRIDRAGNQPVTVRILQCCIRHTDRPSRIAGILSDTGRSSMPMGIAL